MSHDLNFFILVILKRFYVYFLRYFRCEIPTEIKWRIKRNWWKFQTQVFLPEMDDIEVKCFLKTYFAVRFKVSDCEMVSNLYKVSKFSRFIFHQFSSYILLYYCVQHIEIELFLRLIEKWAFALQALWILQLFTCTDCSLLVLIDFCPV